MTVIDAIPAPTTVSAELRRFEAIDRMEFDAPAWQHYSALSDHIEKVLGSEGVTRLEDVVFGLLDLERERTLDRVVVGLIGSEGVAVTDMRLAHRTDYVPELCATPNALATANAEYAAEQARAS